jgi:ABC-type amino acid transport substrate-binding protein
VHRAPHKKNASRLIEIRQQSCRVTPSAQCCHCYFCRALDTRSKHHHHSCIASTKEAIVQEIVMKRREFLKLSLGAAAVASLSPEVRAQASLKEIRIGYQKTGVLVIARQQAVLEKRFAGKQIGIKWIEFTSGPPLLEAMSTGSVDLGAVGDTPPIFAQAANANIVYVAGSPITNGQGILVPANSGIRTIADLKGKRVGHQRHQRAQRGDRHAGKSRADL